MQQLPDDVLVQKAAEGEQEAFGALYDRYLDKVYRHVYFRVPSQVDAEDITQEVFIRAWRAIGRYKKQGAPFVSWLLAIARNLIADFYRANKKHISLEETSDIVSPEPAPEVMAENNLSRGQIRNAISKLKGTKQKVIVLRYIDGFSYAEIGLALRKSEGAIRVILYRALCDLRKIMGNRR